MLPNFFSRNTNSSSKYRDIISKSVLIRSESPAVYQLKPIRESIGTLMRKTVGEKNLNKTNKTILLVGETGTGKSTLINSLVNYTMGVKFEDNIWFQIVEEEERSQTESQTSDVIVYEIFGFEDETLPYSLTIIDTPGFNNTRHIEDDDKVSQRLFDLFCSEDGVYEINAVGLVVRASTNRLNEQLRYIFDSVMSLFGKNMEENIVALITHSDGTTPTNVLQALDAANIKCAKNENQPVHFLFNNSQTKQTTENNEFSLEDAWKVTVNGMDAFTAFLGTSTPQQLKTTTKVLEARIRIKACMHNLKERIQTIDLKQAEIQWTQEAVKKYEQEMEENENFTVEVEEVYKDKEQIKGGMWGVFFYEGAVCCTVCEENCHYPGCTKAWSPESCQVLVNGHCTVCTGKCPVSAHVKENWRFVTKTRKVQKTLEKMKEKYEKNKDENEKSFRLLKNLQKETEGLTAEKNQLVEESYQHVVKLDQIALNVDSVSTYVHLDFLIEKMKEKGDTEKVQKLEEIENRMDEGTRAALRYRFGKIAAAGMGSSFI